MTTTGNSEPPDVVHPDDRARLNAARCFESGESFSPEYRLRRADGAYRWMSGRAEANARRAPLVERCQERLSARERATYLLREAFNYSYRSIARALHLSEANSRHLAARARMRLVDAPRSTVDSAELRRFVVAFSGATRSGDLTELEAPRRRCVAPRAVPPSVQMTTG